MISLDLRVKVAEQIVEKYASSQFEWGKNDCVHLCADTLIGFGYPDPLQGVPNYKTAIGALKTIRKLKIGSISKHLDSLGFERIPPASTLPGDLVQLISEDEKIEAFGVVISPGRVLGFAMYPELNMKLGVAGQLSDVITAWRVS